MKLKNKISGSFSAAAKNYDENAALQKQIAKQLVNLAKHHIKVPSAEILDIGSGTGFIAKELKREIIQADIAFEMCKESANISPVICADIESLPFAAGSFDAVFSSSAMQWLNHTKAIAEIHNILRPNGVLGFSIFGPATLKELRTAFTAAKLPVTVNQFAGEDDIRAVLHAQGFEILRFRAENNKLDFASVKDLLYYMKNIGAGVSVSGNRLTKTGLKKLEENFANGVTSTWEVFYFIAARK